MVNLMKRHMFNNKISKYGGKLFSRSVHNLRGCTSYSDLHAENEGQKLMNISNFDLLSNPGNQDEVIDTQPSASKVSGSLSEAKSFCIDIEDPLGLKTSLKQNDIPKNVFLEEITMNSDSFDPVEYLNIVHKSTSINQLKCYRSKIDSYNKDVNDRMINLFETHIYDITSAGTKTLDVLPHIMEEISKSGVQGGSLIVDGIKDVQNQIKIIHEVYSKSYNSLSKISSALKCLENIGSIYDCSYQLEVDFLRADYNSFITNYKFVKDFTREKMATCGNPDTFSPLEDEIIPEINTISENVSFKCRNIALKKLESCTSEASKKNIFTFVKNLVDIDGFSLSTVVLENYVSVLEKKASSMMSDFLKSNFGANLETGENTFTLKSFEKDIYILDNIHKELDSNRDLSLFVNFIYDIRRVFLRFILDIHSFRDFCFDEFISREEISEELKLRENDIYLILFRNMESLINIPFDNLDQKFNSGNSSKKMNENSCPGFSDIGVLFKFKISTLGFYFLKNVIAIMTDFSIFDGSILENISIRLKELESVLTRRILTLLLDAFKLFCKTQGNELSRIVNIHMRSIEIVLECIEKINYKISEYESIDKCEVLMEKISAEKKYTALQNTKGYSIGKNSDLSDLGDFILQSILHSQYNILLLIVRFLKSHIYNGNDKSLQREVESRDWQSVRKTILEDISLLEISLVDLPTASDKVLYDIFEFISVSYLNTFSRIKKFFQSGSNIKNLDDDMKLLEDLYEKIKNYVIEIFTENSFRHVKSILDEGINSIVLGNSTFEEIELRPYCNNILTHIFTLKGEISQKAPDLFFRLTSEIILNLSKYVSKQFGKKKGLDLYSTLQIIVEITFIHRILGPYQTSTASENFEIALKNLKESFRFIHGSSLENSDYYKAMEISISKGEYATRIQYGIF